VPKVGKPKPREKPTTKARKLENTKKGKGVYETLFFRAFVLRQINGGQDSCFRDGFFDDLCAAGDL